MSSPDIKRTSGQYVSFQFSEGIDAKITIEVREKYSRKGRVETHVIYSSKEDEEYTSLVGSMARAAALVIEHNFADGKDDTETPQDLSKQLVAFKYVIWSFDKEKGHQITTRLLHNAKTEIFNKEQKIKDLTTAQQDTLKEILRWHIEDALNDRPENIYPTPSRGFGPVQP
jgi:hypothetical protein